MYLEIALIDYLNVDGKLTSFNITPKESNSRVVADSLVNVKQLRSNREDVIGGALIHNSNKCEINKKETQLRIHEKNSSTIEFRFDHKNVPLSAPNQGRGLWNFLLPPYWRLKELKVVDPYDKTTNLLTAKKEFEYKVHWDEKYKVQLVEMELISKKGSFSFIVEGTMSLVDIDDLETNYVPAFSITNATKKLESIRILDKAGKQKISTDLANKSNWLEFKPSIYGLSFNLNAIIESINSYIKNLNEKKK